VAEKIRPDDTLRETYPKLNQMIDEVNNFQRQIDEIVVEGDSSVEAAQARISYTGKTYKTLKERLDKEHQEVTAQLAQIEQAKIDQVLFDINTFSVKFYAQGNLITSVNISEAGNAQAVQDYIDTLVANGQIKGVTLADESVTGHKLHPYISGFNNNRTELHYQDGLLVMAVEKDGDLTVSRIQLTYSDDGKLEKITEQAYGKTVETTLVYYTHGPLSYTQNVLR
jgi:hypothetical protein